MIMKFEKQTTINGALVPRSALQLARLGEQGNLEMHTPPGTVVLIRKQMTAAELAQTIESLADLSAQLVACLAGACGTCDDCTEEQCPFDADDFCSLGGLPPSVSEDVNDQPDSPHTPKALSPALLGLLLDNGICLGSLLGHLMQGDVVYG